MLGDFTALYTKGLKGNSFRTLPRTSTIMFQKKSFKKLDWISITPKRYARAIKLK